MAGLRRLPIRLRLAVWFSLFVASSIVAVGIWLIRSLENDLLREVDDAIRLRAASVEREIGEMGSERLTAENMHLQLRELEPLEEFSAPGIYVKVIDPSGAILASSANLRGGLPLTSDLLASAAAGRDTFATLPVGPERVRVFLRPIRLNERILGAVVVGESLNLVDVARQAIRQILIAAAAGAALLCFVGGWWLTGRALQPIVAVTRAARRIQRTGEFAERIEEPTTRDELRDLAVTFNEMLASLEQTVTRQRAFLADASHELRGPLMIIRGNLNLLKHDLPPAERRAALKDAEEDAEQMSRLVADLLFLAEADAREGVEQRPVALNQALAEVYERAQRVDGATHTVELAENQPATILGDRDRLIQLVWNLVENALRYTPPGGRVTLSLEALGMTAHLAVSDTGIGIPEEHLPYVFDRFYRVDQVRATRDGSTGRSTGLGLAIAKQIAQAHGGDVGVTSKQGHGSTFTVTLPLYVG